MENGRNPENPLRVLEEPLRNNGKSMVDNYTRKLTR